MHHHNNEHGAGSEAKPHLRLPVRYIYNPATSILAPVTLSQH